MTRAILRAFSARMRESFALLRSTSALVTSRFGFDAELEETFGLIEMLLELRHRFLEHIAVFPGLEESVIRALDVEDDLAGGVPEVFPGRVEVPLLDRHLGPGLAEIEDILGKGGRGGILVEGGVRRVGRQGILAVVR